MHRHVFDPILEGEGVRVGDFGCSEAWTGVVEGQDLHGGGVDEADIGAGDANRSILHMEEPGVITAVSDKVLVLDACVGTVSVQHCGWKMGWIHLLDMIT